MSLKNNKEYNGKLVRQELFQLLQMGENYISGSFVTSYNVSVETDNVKDMYFSKIPVTPLSLPNDMGVVQVSFIQDQYNPFIRMNTGQLGLYHDMPSESALGKVGFFIENSLEFSQESAQGTKIFYNKGMKKKDCNKEILVKVVTVSEDIAPDDIFPVSPEMQAVIVRNVVELYSVMRNAIADEQNDNIE